MNEITIETNRIKKYMKTAEARAIFGRFYVVGKIVEWTTFNVTNDEADDMYTDDLNALKCGNVDFV